MKKVVIELEFPVTDSNPDFLLMYLIKYFFKRGYRVRRGYIVEE